ncbi:MAG TPA: cell division/cell wall cluster transcriptional repressor MraZ [Candidatus Dormibacteraeota bacterium]
MVGSYRHGVDAKGRVAIPAKLRGGLPEGSMLARGMERRLVIWPPDEWDAMCRRMRAESSGPFLRGWERSHFANTRQVELDAQGRLLLDAASRRYAGIEDRCVFVGLGNRVELVGEAIWDADEAAMTPERFTELYDLATGAAPAASTPTA